MWTAILVQYLEKKNEIFTYIIKKKALLIRTFN